jgi:hypothetical protein
LLAVVAELLLREAREWLCRSNFCDSEKISRLLRTVRGHEELRGGPTNGKLSGLATTREVIHSWRLPMRITGFFLLDLTWKQRNERETQGAILLVASAEEML